jgi:hypothetical protein
MCPSKWKCLNFFLVYKVWLLLWTPERDSLPADSESSVFSTHFLDEYFELGHLPEDLSSQGLEAVFTFSHFVSISHNVQD